MFERFTERSRQVVILAQEHAKNMRNSHIGTEHILLGLLDEEDGLAAKALNHLGVKLGDVLPIVVNRITVREAEDKELEGQLPFTPRAKRVLEVALREALSLGHNYIGTEHVLLGLAREGGVGSIGILQEQFDISPEAIREETMRMLSGPKAPILKSGPESRPSAAPVSENNLYDADQFRKIVKMAIHLGREYPEVAPNRIIEAAKALS